MWFFNLIGGVKGVVVIAIVLALGGYILKLKQDTSRAQSQLTTVTQERDRAATARDQAIAANETNQKTINDLQRERDNIQTALNNLESTRKQDTETINKLRASIKTQMADPANRAKLSPVLADTVRQIQTLREQRAGATK